jgi:hypothetical protein
MEQETPSGLRLIKLKAKPWILTCGESPLVANRFYDRIKRRAPLFLHRISFSGLLESIPNSSCGHNHQIRYPSFNNDDIKPPEAWLNRKYIVMTASNKFWKEPFAIHGSFNENLNYMKRIISRAISRTRRIAVRNELHTKRLEAVDFFSRQHKIEIYGEGWNNLQNLPYIWRRRISEITRRLKPLPYKDKFKTTSEYKFAICFENVAYPGYFTEKIVDCFVSGVIPVYLGAPDITKYMPEDAFIDMRKFNSWVALDKYLNKFSESDAKCMIDAGRNYLKTGEGQKHSYTGFAEFIYSLLP